MNNMKILAAVDKQWGIGYRGKLLVNIPEDMKLFREETMGNIVIMGRKTFESLPNSSHLVGRMNIVLTSNMNYQPRNVVVCHSVSEVLAKVEELLSNEYAGRDVYVIGGESVYKEFLPYCNEAHLTMVDYTYQADRHFPDIESTGEWKVTARSEEKTYFDLVYEFVRYERGGRNEE